MPSRKEKGDEKEVDEEVDEKEVDKEVDQEVIVDSLSTNIYSTIHNYSTIPQLNLMLTFLL
jgi:hypothetical protein